jgi:hypothetical protein
MINSASDNKNRLLVSMRTLPPTTDDSRAS